MCQPVQYSLTTTYSRKELSNKLFRYQQKALVDHNLLKFEQMASKLYKIRPLIEEIADGSDVKMKKLFSATVDLLRTKTSVQMPPAFETKGIAKSTFLEDYKDPSFCIPNTTLHFWIAEKETIVTSELTVRRLIPGKQLLKLHGQDLELVKITINGRSCEYKIVKENLLISVPSQNEFTIQITNKIKPKENKSGQGLYPSENVLLTHNESSGFRRITYFLDRPDNLSTFNVTIEADKRKFPVLLANGVKTFGTELVNNRHSATFELKTPIPSYLFAIVAGDLDCAKMDYVTMSGKTVALEAYTEKGQAERLLYALECLKKAMRWDEEVFGFEYEMPVLRMVAAKDFNVGAMENKSLMIFNSSLLLASLETATDSDFDHILGTVGHEYFHNITGNCVTIKNFLYLFFKEGLTSFRDQEFFADHSSRALARIKQLRLMKERQFAEDASGAAHPLLNQSVISLENLYTLTTYYKGAEVFRMLQTLLGKELFRKGMQLYYQKNLGKAATAEDLVSAMKLAVENEKAQQELEQFQIWFKQAGTPQVNVILNHDERTKIAKVLIKQSCKPSSECKQKEPFLFPFNLGMLDESGKEILSTKTLVISKPEEEFIFENVESKPILSLLRNFSAPVKVKYAYDPKELMILLAHDTDPVNQYEAAQNIAKAEILALLANPGHEVNPRVIEAFQTILRNPKIDPGFKAELLKMPTTQAIAGEFEEVDFVKIDRTISIFTKVIIGGLEKELVEGSEMEVSHDSLDPVDMGKRALKNLCLSYLLMIDAHYLQKGINHYYKAKNLTDRMFIKQLLHYDFPEKQAILDDMFKRYEHIPEVLTEWFAIQAASRNERVMEEINRLSQHPAFDRQNPDMIRSLYRTFFSENLRNFHEQTGKGYELLANEIIRVDKFNSEIASGYLSNGFTSYGKLKSPAKELMAGHINRILSSKPSESVFEILSKILKKN